MRIKKEIITYRRKKENIICFNLKYEEGKNIEIDAKEKRIIYISNNNIRMEENFMKIEELSKSKNKIFIINKGKEDFIFKINNCEEDTANLSKRMNEKDLYMLAYSISYVYYLNGMGNEAIYILSKVIKDKFLATSILNSFTAEERKNTYSHILKAALNRKNSRFINGKLKSRECLKENAFCLIDLLKIFQKNGDKFIPTKKYNRIGRKVKDYFNMFTIDKKYDVLGNFKELVYNSERMNISVRYKINGYVTINPRQAKAVGLFNNIFKSYIYREQTLIKDAEKNIEKFEAIITKKTYQYLINRKVDNIFSILSHDEDSNYFKVLFNVSSIPIINKKYVRKSEGLDSIMELCMKQKISESRKKVINYFIKQKSDLNKSKYTIEQITLLSSYGLGTDGCYSGIDNKREKVEGKYEVKIFDFLIKGWSTIPKVEDVILRKSQGKKLNFLSNVMFECIEDVKYKEYINLNELLVKEKNIILTCKRKLTETKLAKYLSGSFWSDLEHNNKGEFLYKNGMDTLIIKMNKRGVDF